VADVLSLIVGRLVLLCAELWVAVAEYLLVRRFCLTIIAKTKRSEIKKGGNTSPYAFSFPL